MPSKVYLVGAGPGDPELLTLKAARILRGAEAVVYDNLISDEILQLIPQNAEKIFAGKSKSSHLLKQHEINDLLVELSKKYKNVVRLKGGDPFIFGRGGEEVATLRKAKVEFEVIPGITSAQGCSAAIGVPLTHRDYVSGVHFFTGHGCKDLEPNVEWKVLANEDKTLVIYMGLTNIKTIVNRLVENGMKQSTPAVVVENGTTKKQREFYGKLGDLPKILEQNAVKSPALIIIGRVIDSLKN
jgi:uroporphyrin-III C-methyltransferase